MEAKYTNFTQFKQVFDKQGLKEEFSNLICSMLWIEVAAFPESVPGHMPAPGTWLVIQHSHILLQLSAANSSFWTWSSTLLF